MTDFLFPSYGGIESHVYCLAQELLKRGHKVVVVAHFYRNKAANQSALDADEPGREESAPGCPVRSQTRIGVRWLTSGLKVYYVPALVFFRGGSFPALATNLALYRNIFVRERAQIVHGHHCFSALSAEGMDVANFLGLRTVYTDHSLTGFADAGSIFLNKIGHYHLCAVDHAICVSHTAKENFVLRIRRNPWDVSVIPNAVVPENFQPDPHLTLQAWVSAPVLNIVFVSRLVYLKGADLLAAVLPLVCAKFPDVNFIIVGDGNKRVLIDQTLEQHELQSRVSMTGALPHNKICNVLRRGHIFLNTSLTEAFCIGIVEAACVGLHVVSTRVGGVPELLPDDMISFAESCDPRSLLHAITVAVTRVRAGQVDPHANHARVRDLYSWADVAARTERVYDLVCKPSQQLTRVHLAYLRRKMACGMFAGIFFAWATTLVTLLLCVLDALVPEDTIDVAPEFTRAMWQELLTPSSKGVAVEQKRPKKLGNLSPCRRSTSD